MTGLDCVDPVDGIDASLSAHWAPVMLSWRQSVCQQQDALIKLIARGAPCPVVMLGVWHCSSSGTLRASVARNSTCSVGASLCNLECVINMAASLSIAATLKNDGIS